MGYPTSQMMTTDMSDSWGMTTTASPLLGGLYARTPVAQPPSSVEETCKCGASIKLTARDVTAMWQQWQSEHALECEVMARRLSERAALVKRQEEALADARREALDRAVIAQMPAHRKAAHMGIR